MSSVVTGVFTSSANAARAVDLLLAKGVRSEDISVLLSDQTREREFAIRKKTKSSQGAAIGSAAGGTLGALVAGAIALGALAIPGLGWLAAGPLVAALTGAGAGGAAGGLLGGLLGLGFTEYEARLVTRDLENGSILVGVHPHRRELKKTVEHVFDDCHAKSIAH